ncbi:uncharacterized protein TNCV_4640721 [Trichonephila clavipes]|nr:uncharacterized protein TNCV_4640721 [Trichonephila clavipes]
MFIINFEDITNAPYRDAAVSPLPSPARILLNRFPALWRLVPRSRLKPGHAREMPLKGCEDRWKKMKMKFSGNRTQPEDHELTAESPESIQHRSKSVTVSGTKDADSQSTKGDYASPMQPRQLSMWRVTHQETSNLTVSLFLDLFEDG